jgi:hypothetical protein
MSGTRVQYPAGRRPGELTYEDYCALPDDGLRYEVVGGRLFAEPSPRRAHQRAVGRPFELVRGAYSPAVALRGDRIFEPALFAGLAIPLAGLWR